MKQFLNGKVIDIDVEDIVDPAPYEQRVVDRIREVYSIADELAILRQRDTKPHEFAKYNAFVERIKAEEKNSN